MEDLAWLIRTELGEDAEVLERDSASLGAARAAARPAARRAARRRRSRTPCGAPARASCTPTTSSRRSAGGRWRRRGRPGARVVLHLHNYRLVCAVGMCFTRRRGLHALPRPQHAAGRAAELPRRLARGGRRLRRGAGAVAAAARRRASTPSSCRARSRSGGCDELGAPVGGPRARDRLRAARVRGRLGRRRTASYALYAGRLAPEKGVADAVAACARGRPPLVVAGDGPQMDELRALAAGADVRFTGRVEPAELAALRRRRRRRDRARPATRRSCRSPRSRRWRRACRSSPRAPAGSPSSCRARACTRAATSPRSTARLRALWGDARGGRARAGGGARRAPLRPSWRRRCARSTAEGRRGGASCRGGRAPAAPARPRARGRRSGCAVTITASSTPVERRRRARCCAGRARAPRGRAGRGSARRRRGSCSSATIFSAGDSRTSPTPAL